VSVVVVNEESLKDSPVREAEPRRHFLAATKSCRTRARPGRRGCNLARPPGMSNASERESLYTGTHTTRPQYTRIHTRNNRRRTYQVSAHHCEMCVCLCIRSVSKTFSQSWDDIGDWAKSWTEPSRATARPNIDTHAGSSLAEPFVVHYVAEGL